MTNKERIEAVLRDAAFQGEHWLSSAEIGRRTGITDYRLRHNTIIRMDKRRDIRVDRSRGCGRYRYALLTPSEFELRMTQFVVAARDGFDAMAKAKPTEGEER